jgi:transcriptional regulator with XRE-family HTH domain
MAASGTQRGVGELLREWRERRSRTQLDLALDAGISSRHLSFVETGRSKPGRDMLLRVLGQLEVPFREQNQLLLAAGHAPAFPERSFDHADLAPVRKALELILDRHNPYPAVAFDRHWDLVAANATMLALTAGLDIDPALLGPPLNIMRVGFHPKGLAPFLSNLGDWRAHFLERLGRQLTATRDDRLAALLEEVESYPVPGAAGKPETLEPLGPLKVRAPDGSELSLVGMFAAFDTPFEVTASELAVELMYPADRATADALEAFAGEPRA